MNKCIVHPRVGVHFLHTAADGEILFDISHKALVLLVDRRRKCGGKCGGLKVIVAVHSGNFLHHVVLDGNVAGGTPGRRSHVHVVAVNLYVKAKLCELALHLGVGQMLAQSLFQPGQVHVDLGSLQWLHIIIAESGHAKLRIQFFEILHGECQRLVAPLRIDGLLVAGRSLGTGVVAQGGTADACRLKVGNLQDHPLCLRKDGVFRAAHDAGQRNRSLGVRDHQIVRAQFQFFII